MRRQLSRWVAAALRDARCKPPTPHTAACRHAHAGEGTRGAPAVCMRQQLGSSGLTHAAKSSSHDAAGDATYVSCGRRAAAAICATSESSSHALPPHTAAMSGEGAVMSRSSTTYITGGPILANSITSLHSRTQTSCVQAVASAPVARAAAVLGAHPQRKGAGRLRYEMHAAAPRGDS